MSFIVAALAVLVGGVMVAAYVTYRRPLAPVTADRGLNAIWVKHAWVGSAHTEAEYRDFAALLKRNRISDVYVHVGPLNGDGTIDPGRYRHAPQLLARLRAHDGQVRIHAWIGQVEKSGGGPLDLSNGDVRETILVTARQLIDLGFDGIHYDVEPVPSGDPNYVDLLRKSQILTRSRHKATSVAAFKALPSSVVSVVSALLSRPIGLWDGSYFQEVAQSVDHVAVMMYDTALPYDYLYGMATALETRYLVRLMGAQKPLFIGVPTYDDRRMTFHATAENMESGLRGVRMGIEGIKPAPDGPLGVAVYGDWTTNEAEWATYKRLWLQSE
jgi:hypothetical protein